MIDALGTAPALVAAGLAGLVAAWGCTGPAGRAFWAALAVLAACVGVWGLAIGRVLAGC